MDRKRRRADARAQKKAKRHSSAKTWAQARVAPKPPAQSALQSSSAGRVHAAVRGTPQPAAAEACRAEVGGSRAADSRHSEKRLEKRSNAGSGHLGRFVLMSSIADQESESDSDAEAEGGAASAQPELSEAKKEALWASLGLGMEDTNADVDGAAENDASFNGVCSFPEEDAAVAATQYTTLSGYISRGDTAVDGASDSGAASDSEGGSDSSSRSDSGSSGSGSDSGSSSSEEQEVSIEDSGSESASSVDVAGGGRGEAARGHHSRASSANDATVPKRGRSNSWSTTDSMMAREGGQGRRRERSDSLVETVWDDPLIQEEEQQIACVKCACTRGSGTTPRVDGARRAVPLVIALARAARLPREVAACRSIVAHAPPPPPPPPTPTPYALSPHFVAARGTQVSRAQARPEQLWGRKK